MSKKLWMLIGGRAMGGQWVGGGGVVGGGVLTSIKMFPCEATWKLTTHFTAYLSKVKVCPLSPRLRKSINVLRAWNLQMWRMIITRI